MNFKSKKLNLRWGKSPFLALTLSLSLLFSTPTFALETQGSKILTTQKPGKPIVPSGKNGSSSKLPSDAIPSTMGDIQALMIPEAFGTIKEVYKGSEKGNFVFYIQDVHASYEVQENIAKIIDHINRSYFNEEIDLIAVEGAKGNVDLDLLKSVPDQEALKNTSRFLMEKGLMTGPEYYSSYFKKSSQVYGVEDSPLYFDNLLAFRESVRLSGETQQIFEQFENSFYQLLDLIASAELKQLYEKQAAYDMDKLSLSQFCLYLNQVAEKYKADLSKYSNYKVVLDAIALEKKIDFPQLEQQQSRLIQALQQLGDKQINAKLIQNGLDFRTGKIPAHRYYRYLLDTAQKKNMEPKKEFQELFLYGRLTYLQSKIESGPLFQEIDRLTDEIKSQMLTTVVDKRLDQIKNGFEILSTMRQLKLTRDQWFAFSKDKKDFDLNEWRGFMLAEAAKQGLSLKVPEDLAPLTKMIEAPERFYQDAIERDQVLSKNFFQAFNRSKQKVAVLVTGGFHTRGITQDIKAKDISYAVITPRMKKSYDSKLYMDLMMGEAEKFSLAAYSRFENQLTKVNSAFFEEINRSTDQTVKIAIGSILLTVSNAEAELGPFNEWLARANINLIRLQQGQEAVFDYGKEGDRRRLVVKKDVSDPDNLILSDEGSTGSDGPAAFQGGLAGQLVNDYGVTPELASRGVVSTKGDIEVVTGNAKEGADAIKAAVRQNGTSVTVQGVEFVVDKDLIDALPVDVSVRDLINQALNAEEGSETLVENLKQQLESREESNIVLALFDRSTNIAEDHLGNSLIGVNRGLLAALQNPATRPVFTVAFQTALVHELRHEANPVEGIQDTETNLAQFEATQVPKDASLFFALAAKNKVTVDYETLTALTQVLDLQSPFIVQTVSRIATAFNLARNNRVVDAALTQVGADLAVFDNVPSAKQANAFAALGALENAIRTIESPAIVLDVDQLSRKEAILKEINAMVARMKSKGLPGVVQIYLVRGSEARTDEKTLNSMAALFDLPKEVVLKPVERDEEEEDFDYGKKIAALLQENKEDDIRIFASEKLFNAIRVAMAFVNHIMQNSEAITVRFTAQEFQGLIRALEQLFEEDASQQAEQILRDLKSIEPQNGIYIWQLPEEVILDSEYMDTLELARRTLAIQA